MNIMQDSRYLSVQSSSLSIMYQNDVPGQKAGTLRGEERIGSIGIRVDRREILGTGIVYLFFYSVFSMSDLICLFSLLNHFSVPEMGRKGNGIDDFIDRISSSS